MKPQRVLWRLGATLALMAIAGLAAWQAATWHNRHVVNELLDDQAAQVVNGLQDRLRTYELGLRGLRGMIAASGGRNVHQDVVHAYSAMRDFKEEFPGALGMSVAWRVPVAEQDAFVRQMQDQGLPHFLVRQLGPNDGDRWLVSHVEPATRDQSSIGLDLGSDATRRAAIAQVLADSKPTLTAPLKLKSLADAPGVLLLLPYESRQTPATASAGPTPRVDGLVYTPLHLEDVFANIVTARTGQLTLRLRDAEAGSQIELLRQAGTRASAPDAPTVRREVPLYGRTWIVDLTATDALVAAQRQVSPAAAAALAAAGTALLCLMAHLASESNRRVRQVETERQRRAAIIESSDDAVIAETHDGVVIEWNKAAERLFGYTAEQALGRHSATLVVPLERIDEYEANRARIIAGERLGAYDTQRRHANGTLIDVSIAASPILDSEGRCTGYAKTIRDVRETRRAQMALAQLNASLEKQVAERTAHLERARQSLRTVLDAMPSLIGYWDRDLRNQVANRAYRDWFDVEPASLQGRHMSEVMGRRLFDENLPRLNAALAGEAQTFENLSIPRADGHGYRHGLVSYVPDIVDNEVRGLFTLFNDITELVESRAQLAQAQRETAALLQTLRQHAIVSVAGRDGRIIDVNDAFCQISGYTRDELIGQDHAIVNSGTHDKAFWREMWRTVADDRAWRAEVCNRAKDGSVYWVDSIVAPFHDAQGRIERYVSIRHDITPRKLAEAEAERARAAADAASRFLRELTDRLPLRISYLDRELRFRFVNSAMCERFGHSREALLGRTRAEILERPLAAHVQTHVRTALAGEAQSFEYEEITDGEPHTFEARLVPDRDASGEVIGLFAVSAEVTDRRRQEIERRRTLTLLDAVLNASTQVSIIATDPDGVVSVFNRGAEQMLGTRADEVVGQANLLRFHDMDELAERARALPPVDGRPVPAAQALVAPQALNRPQECHYRRADGQRVPVSLLVNAMHDDQGQFAGYVGVAHDISQRQAQERSLRHAVAQADAANRAKSTFLANMSHEIRTPMNAVIGLIYLLEQGRLDADQAATLARVKVASRQLLDIINDVLDLSKIEAGEMRMERTTFDLRALVGDITQLMGMQAETKGIALQARTHDLPTAVQGDPTRLRQVLINLVGNAIKFTERGSVHLEVRVTGRSDDGCRLTFAVEDTGIGISTEAQSRLFAPFVQADNSTTRRFGGTGLGLSIVRQLVQLMGGEIGVTSREGQGSRFSFDLELPLGDSKQLPSSVAAVMTGQSLRGVRVLVVDDNPINQDVAQRVLALEGAVIEVADNGRIAVDRLKADGAPIHVVLMDVQMPELDGCDATRLIRDELGLRQLPVIGLSAGVSAEEAGRVRRAGMDDLVGKPFDPPQLVQRICLWLKHRNVVIGDGDGEAAPTAHTPAPAPAPAAVVAAVAAPVAAPDNWPVVDGLDAAASRRFLGGSVSMLRDLLGRLVSTFADLADTPPDQRTARLHDLKGTSATLGARAISQAAGDAERASRRGEDVSAALQALADQLEALRASATRAGLVAPPPASSTLVASLANREAPLDAAAMAELVAQLHDFDLAAVDSFQAQAGALRARLGSAEFDALKAQIDALDFSAAAEALAPLTRQDSETSA